MEAPPRNRQPVENRQRLIDAGIRLMLRQGYAGTSVDGICAEAGLTKGAFFHHFAGKEDLCRAAIARWGEVGCAIYAPAWDDDGSDPLDRLERLFAILIGLHAERAEPCICMVGMVAQELALTHPALRDAAAGELATWSRRTADLLAAVKRHHPPARDVDPEAVAWLLNSVWQGSMLVAKATGDREHAMRSLALARDQVLTLFPPRKQRS